jgi:MFS-type transporter involved in bile tolerance (Atg22 family)
MLVLTVLGYKKFSLECTDIKIYQEGLFKLVTLDRILNRITGVTSGCWWLVVVNAVPILDICQINQQNISSCSVINNRIKNFS